MAGHRKVTIAACDAFMAGRPFHSTNTDVVVDEEGNVKMLLFGNAIAKRKGERLFIRTAGWNSATTRERLSGLPGLTVSTEKGAVYLWRHGVGVKPIEWREHAEWTEV